MSNIITSVKTLFNPKNLGLILSLKELAEAFGEVTESHPKLEEPTKVYLAVLKKELDDTVDGAKEIHEMGAPLMPDATEDEVVNVALLMVATGMASKALFTK